jgi:hypothetical protein
MLIDKPIIVIQNTSYHFETALSIYQSLSSMGLSVYFYRCADNVFDQESFLKDINVNIASEDTIKKALCGFVVSAYQNPQAAISNPIPNSNDLIFEQLKNKLIYISHRFKNESDYTQVQNSITKENSICLSPIAGNLGLDYFHPIEMPLKEKYVKIHRLTKLTVQSHFNLKGRTFRLVLKILRSQKIRKYKNLFKINFLGTKPMSILDKFEENLFKNINQYDGLQEKNFYNVINSNTNFLMCLIDDKIKNQTYFKERYSSNFNHALAFNKPVFCHECFENIYKIPGIYYNNDNLIEKFEELLNLNEENYLILFKKFDLVKKEKKEHNDFILSKKISLFLK